MLTKRFLGLGFLAVSALGLGACVDQYAYGRAPGYYDEQLYYSQYDRFYGDPYGFRYVPIGFVGGGFGWFNNFYYPGVGPWVYDRRGVRHGWNRQQQGFWQPRVAQRQVFLRGGGGISNQIGRSIANQQQLGRDQRGWDQRGWDQRGGDQRGRDQRGRDQRGRGQVDQRGNQSERQQLRAQREGTEIARGQAQGQGQEQARAQGRGQPLQGEATRVMPAPERQARAERPVRQQQAQQQVQQRPQRELRQQYQRQQQSYRSGRERRQPR